VTNGDIRSSQEDKDATLLIVGNITKKEHPSRRGKKSNTESLFKNYLLNQLINLMVM
jgi:hypothetical protein